MKVYIASKYIDHQEINRKIYDTLIAEGIDAFLPASINVDALTVEEMKYVADICYGEIRKCDTILIVEPYGNSVSCEIGYAIDQKHSGQQKRLILLTLESLCTTETKKEAMIQPYIDVSLSSIWDLVNYLKRI